MAATDKTYLFESDNDFLARKQRQKTKCCNCRCWTDCVQRCRREKQYYPRLLSVGRSVKVQRYPPNVICNQKYNFFTFLPIVIYEQFSVFLNLVFLVMACSQFIPALRIGELYTYWAPLTFVVLVTMVREFSDDILRWKRDREVNLSKFTKLTRSGQKEVNSEDIKVGDLIIVHKNQRIPADMVLLRTSETTGAIFLRTDQLDGETDWKLRLAVPTSQALENDDELFGIQAQVFAEKPNRSIHSFEGTFAELDGARSECPLSIDNTMWANTVLASGTSIGLVIYTGKETRAVMNSSQPRSKFGSFDREVNNLTKLLVAVVVIISICMMALKGFGGRWYLYLWRFFLLFSYIIPLALRVNMDLAKIVSSFMIMRDKDMEGNIVRTSTIPEELGRIHYLMSDKTGTLTQNDMVFKKLHLGTVCFGADTMDEVTDHVTTQTSASSTSTGAEAKVRRTVADRVFDSVLAIGLCHNVTPVIEESGETSYQASSPDEVALVSWAEQVGLRLIDRDLSSMVLKSNSGKELKYEILNMFPFTSETKRMGIILRNTQSRQITFYVKGADTVMTQMVVYTDWLEEEADNTAREGLRTLVVAKKDLSEEQYRDFERRLHEAKMSMVDRANRVADVVASLEKDLETLCLTGVEDKLQDNVRPTLETLRNAGIRVWMLTGDKMETAECIAKSCRLVGRGQTLHTFAPVTSRNEAHVELNSFRRHNDSALVITGASLQVCLDFYQHEFIELACQCPAVIVCRCSPTQKAGIVKLVQDFTRRQTAAIGDGGNDVSMIQAADVGLGLVGKEGKQASLASDFSLTQFHHITKLLLVHGRNSYKNSANLSQFIIHRGVLISVMQVIFSAVFSFVAIPLFPGFLLVGYATVFTAFPVFSLVLDKDLTNRVALTYPELYKELVKGRELTFKTFFIWLLISIYQGGIIMYGSLLLFEEDFVHVVTIAFTSTLCTELLMVILTVCTWHILMVIAEIMSIALYVFALVFLKDYFDQEFLHSLDFLWKVLAITAVSNIPLFILKYIRFKLRPPVYSKLQGH